MTAPVRFQVRVDNRPAGIRVNQPRVTVQQPGAPRVVLAAVPGRQGQPGPPGSGVQVFGEVPAGTRDGVNAVFTTAHPFLANATAVFVNGLRERRTVGYAETSSTTITFSTAPGAGDDIMIDYIVA